MIIAIATTWYVVFTHDIMRANEEMLRYQAQPHLGIAWSCSETPRHIYDNADRVADGIWDAVNGVAGQKLNAGSPDRIHAKPTYAAIRLTNHRASHVRKIEVYWTTSLTPKNTIGTIKIPNISNHIILDNLNLGPKEFVEIGVASLTSVPTTFGVGVMIDQVNYLAVDSTIEISAISGEMSYTFQGTYEFSIQQQPPTQPIQGQ